MTQRWVENTRVHFWTFSPVSVNEDDTLYILVEFKSDRISPRESAKIGRMDAHGLNCKIFVDSELTFKISMKIALVKKFLNLTRERQFVQFLHFHKDLSDPSQILPKYRGHHSLQKSRKKIGNIYGHLAKIAIWNLKNGQNFKIYENFKSVLETWNLFS